MADTRWVLVVASLPIALALLLGPSGVVKPCRAGTPEWIRAKGALDVVSAKMSAITSACLDGDDRDGGTCTLGSFVGSEAVVTARAAIERLMANRCFFGAREEGPSPEDAPGLALVTWWRAGGERWLRSFLELYRPSPNVVIPPDVRNVFDPDESSPLAILRCNEDDETCAGGDRWRNRLQKALDAQFVIERQHCGGGKPPESCTRVASTSDQEGRYSKWRECIDDRLRGGPALPLGRIRLPDQGWLVLRGRRGHYEFCDEVRAYSLRTGAAYVASSCSGLVLRKDGSVDGEGTDKNRRVNIVAGTLPLDELRSATLAIVMIPLVESDVHREALAVLVPRGIVPGWRAEMRGVAFTGCIWSSSGQTRLTWTYRLQDGRDTAGSLTWPDSAIEAEAVAANWLAALDERFEQACPPEKLAAEFLVWTRAPGVNRLDAPKGVSGVQEDLVSALVAWRPPPSCVGGAADGSNR